MKSPLEVIQNTDASTALRALVWRHRRQLNAELLASPAAVTAESRTFAAGGARALEELYDELAKVLQWRAAGDSGKPADVMKPAS